MQVSVGRQSLKAAVFSKPQRLAKCTRPGLVKQASGFQLRKLRCAAEEPSAAAPVVADGAESAEKSEEECVNLGCMVAKGLGCGGNVEKVNKKVSDLRFVGVMLDFYDYYMMGFCEVGRKVVSCCDRGLN